MVPSDALKVWLYAAAAVWFGTWTSPLLYNFGKAIAEALIATAFGLGIAITALLPFNYLNARLEQTRHEIENAATRLELMTRKNKNYENFQPLR